jgi:hypothetical protein
MQPKAPLCQLVSRGICDTKPERYIEVYLFFATPSYLVRAGYCPGVRNCSSQILIVAAVTIYTANLVTIAIPWRWVKLIRVISVTF